MDVMRVDTEDGQRRFCCCVAAYGYMGDLMCESERLRWMGPGRYNIAGALSLLKNKVIITSDDAGLRTTLSLMGQRCSLTAECHFCSSTLCVVPVPLLCD
jgi:hypothetical protein